MKKSFSRPPLKVLPRPLTQADIDAPPSHPDSRPWYDNSPGPWLSIIVFVFFLAGVYALYSLWGMTEIYRIATSAKG